MSWAPPLRGPGCLPSLTPDQVGGGVLGLSAGIPGASAAKPIPLPDRDGLGVGDVSRTIPGAFTRAAP